MQAPPKPPVEPAAQAAQPSAQGSFAKTPFPHLLVYALARGLNGTFELHLPSGESLATMLVVQGSPAKARLTEGVHYLGEVMQDLGLVSAEALKASQERMAESPRLQGQILLELGAVDEARLEAGVRAQLERKLEHLFTLPAETLFSYFDGVDNLQRYGGPPTPVDPLPSLWRGIRQAPAWEHVDATLRRVGSAAVRIAPGAQLDRFQFTRVEGGALDLLRQRPLRLVDLANAKVVGPSVAQLLLYVLVITKQVDLVETASVPPGAPPAAPSAPTSTGRLPVPASAPGSSRDVSPASGQAFARVQLQAKSIQRAPLIVEEAPVTRSAMDGRIASPLPQEIPLPDHVQFSPEQSESLDPDIPPAPPAPVITGMPPADSLGLGAPGLDIGAMISTTILSSIPPPVLTDEGAAASAHPSGPPSSRSSPPSSRSAPSSPPSSRSAPPSAAGSSGPPPPPSSQRVMPPAASAEQSGLRQRILERAANISSQDYFEMLGLARDASPETVQKAFFVLAKVWHPDRLPPSLLDLKDECSKIFTHLTEAQATLCDPERKLEYMTLLKDGGATPDDQAKIQAILEAASEFQKAEILLRRNDTAQARELAAKSHALDPEQADYLVMLTWIDAQDPQWIGREKTLEKIAVLDSCIKRNANSERAYFWRAMLYKRIDEGAKSYKDFKKASELNPRNLDALREVRLYKIRGGQSKPPPAPGGGSDRPAGQPPAKAPQTLGGLFGKLFKK